MLDIQLLRNQLDAVVARLACTRRCAGHDRLSGARGRAQGPADEHAGSAGAAQQSLEADRTAEGQGRRHRERDAGSRRPGRRPEASRGPARRAARPIERLHRDSAEPAPRERTARQLGRRQRRDQALGHAESLSTSRSRTTSTSAPRWAGWTSRSRSRSAVRGFR